MDKLEFAFPPGAAPTFPSWRLSVLKALAGAAGVPLVKITNENAFAGALPRKCKTPAIKATDSPSTWISEFGAVCRHLGIFLDTDLYPSFHNLPFSNERATQIDQWIDYSVNNLDNNYALPLVGQLTKGYDSAAFDDLVKGVRAELSLLELHLKSRTWLAGNAMTLADVVAASTVKYLFEHVLEGGKRKSLPSITRWFETCLSQPFMEQALGKIAYCTKVKVPQAKTKGGKPKADGKQKQKGKGGGKPAKQAKGKGADKGGKGKKKETQLGLDAQKFEEFGDWYSEVCTKSEMISYYEISGCYILRPWAYSIWDTIHQWFDGEIKSLGVQNCYFPLFVTENVLNKEKDHVEDFAPEVAWVTKSGQTDLDVPIAIRPTSETVMYPFYANWIRSHRDLPLRLNQWCNVIRWEFKHPTPFIRSREFLWQEGHTAFAQKEEADAEVLDILDLYSKVYEELLAVPVMKGRKSEKEKFAGALYTTTVEAFVPATGKGVQGATSHCLGQNFSKMFDIEFEKEDRKKDHVWQNSWGITTRTIGVMIMVHGDNKGLVLPPRVAPVQVVVIPIPKANMTEEQKKKMQEASSNLYDSLKAAGVRVKMDDRENYTPGWKYSHWELKGIPLRCEIGPKDLDKEQAVLARRDTGKKDFVPWADCVETTKKLLADIQKDMLESARAEFNESIVRVTNWDGFVPALDAKKMILAPWCEEVAVEEDVKTRSASEEGAGAKTLCIPFDQPELPTGTKCFASGKPAKSWALWGRSY
ncbi:prolyl-tRNA ligase [Chloropicon primus]|uniref:proline--tRNA ligase n=2 Tax=Chloropicon primus TaxID=1764295 RepID=A0A5B8MF99_9CHLO|nr:prolyl-tRNA ligase [Chloropicon primus]UPQ97237.1 prolyl-tRNA ligase [Chloropicon primus]|eukprot:QDZ18022.1 prolyl-tRNA ligase [Chloropicon primus]